MSDFCQQCSEEMFDKDFGDFKGLTTAADVAEGKYATVLCEDCGVIQVDPEGRCVSLCTKGHSPTKEREALLAAADYIEKNPERYNFASIYVSSAAPPTGCVLGIIGFFLNRELWGQPIVHVCLKLGVVEGIFYDRLTALSDGGIGGIGGITRAKACPQALRRYADKYYPDPMQQQAAPPQSFLRRVLRRLFP